MGKQKKIYNGTRIDIIKAVKTPLGYFTLVVLITETSLMFLATRAEGLIFNVLVISMIALIFSLVFIVAYIAIRNKSVPFSLTDETHSAGIQTHDKEQTELRRKNLFNHPEPIVLTINRDEAATQFASWINEATEVTHTFFFARHVPLKMDAIICSLQDERKPQIKNTRFYTANTYQSLLYIKRLFEKWHEIIKNIGGKSDSTLSVYTIFPEKHNIRVSSSTYPLVNITLLQNKANKDLPVDSVILSSHRIQNGNQVNLHRTWEPKTVDFFKRYFESLKHLSLTEQINSLYKANERLNHYRLMLHRQVLDSCNAISNYIVSNESGISSTFIIGSAINPLLLDPRHFDVDLVVVLDDTPNIHQVMRIRKRLVDIVPSLFEKNPELICVESRDGPIKTPPIPWSEVLQLHVLVYGKEEVCKWSDHIVERRLSHKDHILLFQRENDNFLDQVLKTQQQHTFDEKCRSLFCGSYGIKRCLEISQNPNAYWYTERPRDGSNARVRIESDGTLLYQEFLKYACQSEGIMLSNDQLRRFEQAWRTAYLSWYSIKNLWFHFLLLLRWIPTTEPVHIKSNGYGDDYISLEQSVLQPINAQIQIRRLLVNNGYNTSSFDECIDLANKGVGETAGILWAYNIFQQIHNDLIEFYDDNSLQKLEKMSELLNSFATKFSGRVHEFYKSLGIRDAQR